MTIKSFTKQTVEDQTFTVVLMLHTFEYQLHYFSFLLIVQ